ncbi:hypothetical protein NQZ68_016640 [Dissostichus eleginoides]|nr:hypothetical protein NQZ68_016640 [Dissostichus eleginoides]
MHLKRWQPGQVHGEAVIISVQNNRPILAAKLKGGPKNSVAIADKHLLLAHGGCVLNIASQHAHRKQLMQGVENSRRVSGAEKQSECS